MLRDEAIQLMKERLKRANTSIYDDIILREMLHVQHDVLEKGPDFPWFLTSPFTYITLNPGDSSVELPPDFLCEDEDSTLRLINDTDAVSSPMHKATLDELLNFLDSTSTQYLGTHIGEVPIAYTIENETLHFSPECPNDGKSYRIRWKFIRRDIALNSNIENNWLKWGSDVFIGETGKLIAASHIRDPAGVALMKDIAERGWKSLWEMHEQRKNANMSYVMQYS